MAADVNYSAHDPWEIRIRRFGIRPEQADGRPRKLTTRSLAEYKSWFGFPVTRKTQRGRISLSNVGNKLTPRMRFWIMLHVMNAKVIEDPRVIAKLEKVAGPFHCMAYIGRERVVADNDPLIFDQHYCIGEFERLVHAPGGQVRIRVPTRLVCNSVEKVGEPPPQSGYDMVIEGKDGNDGQDGKPGDHGKQAQNGDNLECSGCDVKQKPQAGGPGDHGKRGDDGQDGEHGGDAPFTRLEFRRLSRDYYILNIGGRGGRGGAGGRGGDGSDGGQGGNGGNCCCTHEDSKPGGPGGNGGDGRNGGDGKDGGKGATVNILVTEESRPKVKVTLGEADGGEGGSRGDGGDPGRGGKGGSESGKNGNPGNPGNPGNRGNRGNPGVEHIEIIRPARA